MQFFNWVDFTIQHLNAVLLRESKHLSSFQNGRKQSISHYFSPSADGQIDSSKCVAAIDW
jgi:hypothetical protein